MSADGTVLAIGDMQGQDTSGVGFSGLVMIYKYNLTNWKKVGNTLFGKISYGSFGGGVKLSSNGEIVSISSSQRDDNGTNSGAGMVYKNINNIWVQIGNDILGESIADFCSIPSISGSGNVLIAGSKGADTANGIDTGKVRIFENIQGTWVEQGSIIGLNAGDQIGSSVALSRDGLSLAIGNPLSNTISAKSENKQTSLQPDNYQIKGNFPGSVQVFDISGILSSNTFVQENFKVYPNPTTDILNIELDKNLTLEKVLVYDTTGKLVKETTVQTINVSNFAKGIYNVKVITNQGSAIKKVIVK